MKIFEFKQDPQQQAERLDWLKLHRPDDFQRVTMAGQAILKAAE
jgi:hypothetical protein